MKIDLHVHSQEVSCCGKVSSMELVKLYRAAGYDAIVLTNHFSRYTEARFQRCGMPDLNAVYHEEFRKTAELGKRVGLLVLCGYEMRFDTTPNDYLVFGPEECDLVEFDKILAMTPEAFNLLAKQKNWLFYQAHPFRNGMQIINPTLLFGIEVKNGHTEHDSRNDVAEMWADKFALHKIGGSDCHETHHVGRSGIETDGQVRTMAELMQILRNDSYRIL